MPWTGYDLDGTLARWDGDVTTIGTPIPRMVARCTADLAAGKDVRIITARVGPATEAECAPVLRKITEAQYLAVQLQTYNGTIHDPTAFWTVYQTCLITAWCAEHLGKVLPITAVKDFHMEEFYDDRCKQVVTNSGILVEEVLEGTMAELISLRRGTPPERTY